ncbi:MAG: zinc ABC transporter substrate-binding protein [Brachymonas sp.]|nr:zinc ABC transporter substrate-binding protein [Brachymonas sp.]
MRIKAFSSLFKTFVLAGLLGLGSAWASTAKPLPVVTSFSILADVAQQIGGERVAVQPLVAADTDAHSYQMTPADVRKIRSAKLLLVNGLGMESAPLQRAMQSSKIPLAVVTQGITPLPTHDHHHDHDHDHSHDHGHAHGHDHHGHHHHSHGDQDPHVWQDPVHMQTYARNIANALIQADPAGKPHYEQRLAAYQRELQQLHTWAEQQFAAIPPAQRKVLTAHEAFAYLGARYQITFVAPLGVSADSDASARRVARLIQQVRTQGIRAIFLENVKDARLIEQIARETGVPMQQQALYSDALSGPQGPAPTYLQLMRHNINALATALKAKR